MLRYLAKRLGLVVITLVMVSMMVFAVAQVLPGDVGRTILGPYASVQAVATLDHHLGLDRPLYIRYLTWVAEFVHGDWGKSYLLDMPAKTVVLNRFGNSLILAGFALVLIIPTSIVLGVIAAINEGRWLDRAISITGLSLIALPEFLSGVILLVLFAIQLSWFPVSSQVPTSNPLDWIRQLLLPSIPLMFVLFGYIARMARAGTVEALASGYTRTAILKGLSMPYVLWHHVLRNALLPTITVISVQAGYLVGGLVVVETLFRYPGIGKLILDSAIGHDIPVLQASMMLIAVLFTLLTLTADLLYFALSPRIRLSGAG